MAKPKLTREMVAFIVNLRDDVSNNYTFNDIEKMLFERFGVEISYKSIHKAYHKHKDNISHITITTNQKTVSDSNETINDISTTKDVKPKKNTGSNNSDRLNNFLLNKGKKTKGSTNNSNIDLNDFEMDQNLLNEFKGD